MHKLKHMYLLTFKLGAFPMFRCSPFVVGIRIAEMHYCILKQRNHLKRFTKSAIVC